MKKAQQNEYERLSELDKKILCFSGKIIISETSKTLILLLIFALFHKIPEFLFSMVILFPIRCQIGGIHLKTYIGCLITTIAIFTTAIIILPENIRLSEFAIIGLLLLCTIICFHIGPIINPTRPKLTILQIKKCKLIACSSIICYIMLSFALQFNRFIVCGAWIIIIQTLQLIAANLITRRKKS